MGGVFKYNKPQPETHLRPPTIREIVSDGTLYAYRHRQRQDLTHSQSWLADRARGLEAQEHEDLHAPGPEDSFGVCCLYCGLAWALHPEAVRVAWERTGQPFRGPADEP